MENELKEGSFDAGVNKNNQMYRNHEAEIISPAGLITHSPDVTVNQSLDGSTRTYMDTSLRITAPPNGGYGWVIVCGAFFGTFLVDGACFSFGIFFADYLDEFGEDKETTSWAGSVHGGMSLITGPLVAALANRLGCRVVCIAGSLMSSAGLILSTLVPNIGTFIVTYGVMAGTGFGMIRLTSIVIVGQFFTTKRAFATGLAVCGAGLGAVTVPVLCELLIQTYAWKGALWILAGMTLNGVICGALFRPPETSGPHWNPNIATGSQGSSPISDQFIGGYSQKQSSYDMVTTHEPYLSVRQGNDKGDSNWRWSSMPSLSANDVKHSNSNMYRFRLSQSCDLGSIWMYGVPHKPCTFIKHSTPTAPKVREYKPHINNDSDSATNLHTICDESDKAVCTSIIETRVDSANNVDMMVISAKSAPHEESACKSITKYFKDMADCELLTHPGFCVYGLSCFLCNTGYYVPFFFLPNMAVSFGLSRGKAAMLLSIIGGSSTVTRVVIGWVSDQPWANCVVINNCALIVGGGATIVCPFCQTFPLLAVYALVFGCCIATFVTLRSIIMVELMGLQKLASAFGLVTMCQGMSSFVGAPVAGALFDSTGYYNLSFYVAGICLVLAGAICLPLRRVSTWWDTRVS